MMFTMICLFLLCSLTVLVMFVAYRGDFRLLLLCCLLLVVSQALSLYIHSGG